MRLSENVDLKGGQSVVIGSDPQLWQGTEHGLEQLCFCIHEGFSKPLSREIPAGIREDRAASERQNISEI